MGSCEKGFFAREANGTVRVRSSSYGCTAQSASHMCCVVRTDGTVVQCSKWQSAKAMTHVHSVPEPHRLGTDVFGLWQ